MANAAQLRPSAVGVFVGRGLVPTVACSATGGTVTLVDRTSRPVSTPSTTVTRYWVTCWPTTPGVVTVRSPSMTFGSGVSTFSNGTSVVSLVSFTCTRKTCSRMRFSRPWFR